MKMEEQEPQGPSLGPGGAGDAPPHLLGTGSPGEFPRRMLEEHIKQESEEGSIQTWEAQAFIRTVEAPPSGWETSPDQPSLWDKPSPLPDKPSPWDDTKAFLDSFEQVAEACQWPKKDWVPRLLPALGEEAMLLSSLVPRDREDYGKVKATLLRGEALSREKNRQHFRHGGYQEAEGPRGTYNRLHRLCSGWLKVERHSKEQLLDLLVLEQLLTVLPPEVQTWVRDCGAGTCSQAVELAENFLWRQREDRRQENQVPFAAVSFPPAVQALPVMEPCLEIKQEDEDAGAVLSARKADGEPLRISSARVDQEVLKENFWNNDGPQRHEGGETEKGRVQAIPCQFGDFPEIPVQPENQTGTKRRTFLNARWRIQIEEKPGKNFKLAKSFTENRNLREKRHKCVDCGKQFSQSTHLTLHRRIHTGEKPYKCLQCGKRFSRKGSLTSHLRSHTGEKPYACLECGRSFSFSSNLLRHRRTHYKKKTSMPVLWDDFPSRHTPDFSPENSHQGESFQGAEGRKSCR